MQTLTFDCGAIDRLRFQEYQSEVAAEIQRRKDNGAPLISERTGKPLEVPKTPDAFEMDGWQMTVNLVPRANVIAIEAATKSVDETMRVLRFDAEMDAEAKARRQGDLAVLAEKLYREFLDEVIVSMTLNGKPVTIDEATEDGAFWKIALFAKGIQHLTREQKKTLALSPLST